MGLLPNRQPPLVPLKGPSKDPPFSVMSAGRSHRLKRLRLFLFKAYPFPSFLLFSVTLGWVSVGLLEPDKASKSMPHSAADAAAVVIESRSRSVGLAVPDTIY